MKKYTSNDKILFHLESIHNNEILSFEIHPTNVCNYNCSFCSYSFRKSNRQQLKLEIILDTINKIREKGCKSIILAGGGDPTMFKELPEVINYIKSQGMEVALLTNGSNIKMLEEISSSCTYVLLNIVSTNKYLYKRMMGRDIGSILDLPKSIGQCTTIGVRVVVTNENINDLVRTTNDLISNGFDYVQITPAVNYEGTSEYINLTKFRELISSNNIFLEENILLNIKNSNTYKGEKCFNVSHNSHGILAADGHIYICPPLTSLSLEYSIGNIYDQQFNEIWNGVKHRNLISKMNEKYRNKNCENCRFIGYNQILNSNHEILKNPHSNII